MQLRINNFRSIQDQEVTLAPITLVYGPNGAGKSSLIYALLALKNLVLNPNQAAAGFFNFTFASLGSFEAVVFDHRPNSEIGLSVTIEKDSDQIGYGVTIAESQVKFTLNLGSGAQHGSATLSVPLPYAANQQTPLQISGSAATFSWNGVTATATAPSPENPEEAQRITALLNAPVELLRKVSVIPLRRGFSRPFYSVVPVSPLLITEDEVATMLAQNKYLVSKVSFYLEQIVGRDFRVNFQPGTSLFSLDALDKGAGIASELVNDGFGVNQLVFLLAKCLHPDVEWLCVEEPEIHLHPTALKKLVQMLVHITRNEGKRVLLSTHSEAFVAALLAEVMKRDLAPSDVACYLARKERKVTSFERQAVTEQGQIEGGLSAFMEGELQDVRAFLNA